MSDGGVDFEFGDESEYIPDYYYFNRKGHYSKLLRGIHFEGDLCCDDCLRHLSSPSDLDVDFSFEENQHDRGPTHPIVYALRNVDGTLNVIKTVGPAMHVGPPPNGYIVGPGADEHLLKKKQDAERDEWIETMRMNPAPFMSVDWRDDLVEPR